MRKQNYSHEDIISDNTKSGQLFLNTFYLVFYDTVHVNTECVNQR